MHTALRGMSRFVFSSLVLLIVSLTIASAQMPTGTILGTVKDSTGAVVPDATVTVRNAETGFTRALKSETNGSYRVAALPVGVYEIRAEQMGFQTEVRSNVGLSVAQEAVVNFSLQVGTVEQTVEVTGEAPLVNTTSGSLGTLVNEQQVTELPLNGRNYINLTLLQPGVVQRVQASQQLQGGGTWMSINGATLRSNFYTLDGAPMENAFEGTSASVGSNTLGVEGVREWRVVTNNASSAEYGMRMGGQLSIVSKGGTNNFHGSLFEYLRNSVLDARNFFDYKTDAFKERLPGFRRNQFGASAGGPIKKDKLFAFGTYEALRERLGVTTITNTIGAGCQGPAGATITNVTCPQMGTTASVTIAPVIAPFLALYPAPNLSGNRYTFPFSSPTTENYGQIRGDYNISNSDSAFIRSTTDDAQVTQPLPYPQFTRQASSRSNFATVSESHSFGSAMVGTFRVSYTRYGIISNTVTDLTGPQYTLIPGRGFGRITVGAATILGSDTFGDHSQQLNLISYSGDLFYTKGRHSFKFGTLINQYPATKEKNNSGVNGAISFTNVGTFLAGNYTSYSGALPGVELNRRYKYATFGFYLQDDLRVVSNFTLNLGLRYEFHNDFREVEGRESTIRNPLTDAAFTVGKTILNPSLKNISPRFGFAWDVRGDGKTAVRGGFGMLYDVGVWIPAMQTSNGSQQPFQSSGSVNTQIVNPFVPPPLALPLVFPPGSEGKTAMFLKYHMTQPYMLSYSLTVEQQLPFNTIISLGYSGSRGIHLLAPLIVNPLIPSVLSDGQLFWTANNPRPNPNWNNLTEIGGNSDSSYNSLQVVLKKQLSKGLQFQSAYTWSKMMDLAAGINAYDHPQGTAATATSQIPQKLDHGPSSFNIAQALRVSTIYHFPEVSGSQGIAGTLLSGWWTSGILSTQTGGPFSVTIQTSRSLGAAVDRPNLNAGRNNANIVSGTTAGCLGVAPGQKLGGPDLYYDPCAFSLQAPGFLGNAGRNFLYGPGMVNLDSSLVKDTRVGFLGEGGNLQFRAEVFNIFNRPNFFLPNPTVFSGGSSAAAQAVQGPAGKITTTATRSRQIQLALKLVW